MMSINVASLLNDTVTATKRVQTRTTIDFVDQIVNVDTSIEIVIQPASAEDLTVDVIDWSIRHVKIWSTTDIEIDDFILYQGITYLVVQRLGYNDFGYTKVIAEEQK